MRLKRKKKEKKKTILLCRKEQKARISLGVGRAASKRTKEKWMC